MVTISQFNSLRETDAEALDVNLEEWLDALAQEPHEQYAGQMMHSGWSPAVYDPPKRSASNVRRVFALVLDHDHGATFERLTELWSGNSGVVYTTKSHTVENPRYRTVLALSRAVTATEYTKVWQWASERCAVASCPADQQCKDASRFWYDPTVPPGGWRAQRLSGPAVDVEYVLSIVPAPAPLRVVRPTAPASQTDRVRRARAYLAKLPPAIDGQAGHTATFNAVAHVLIGFDLSESDAYDLIASEYNPRCEPPWSERELQHKISSVAKTCKRERGYLLIDRPRIENTRSAAHYAPSAPEELDVDWTTLLLKKADGTAKRGYRNVSVFVRHHPEFRGKWSMDLMTRAPWFDGKLMDASFVDYIREQADCRLGFTPTPYDVGAAIVAAAQDRPFHPIRQYLRSLDWDGVGRLDSMARDYFFSESALHAAMVRKFMVGAAARALWPGCKLDTALMLVGPQGYRKSTFFRVLGGPWHSDSYLDINNYKDATLQLHSAWIYELAELENVVTGKAESRLKAWMSSEVDRVRPPYAKDTIAMPRAVALCGSTNRRQFLTDDTGSRRFLIIPVTRPVPFETLQECRDQLWAEAVCAAESGDQWWLDPESEQKRDAENAEYAEDDSWTETVSQWLDPPAGAPQERVTVTEVLLNAVRLDIGKHGRWEQMRVARILKHLGWVRKQEQAKGVRKWHYEKAQVTQP